MTTCSFCIQHQVYKHQISLLNMHDISTYIHNLVIVMYMKKKVVTTYLSPLSPGHWRCCPVTSPSLFPSYYSLIDCWSEIFDGPAAALFLSSTIGATHFKSLVKNSRFVHYRDIGTHSWSSSPTMAFMTQLKIPPDVESLVPQVHLPWLHPTMIIFDVPSPCATLTV